MHITSRLRLLQHLPSTHEIRNVLYSFSGTKRIAISVLLIAFLASTIWVLGTLNAALSTRVPVSGGTITEGVLGTPRFVNPVLALSDADNDLSALVYAGLLKQTPDGTYAPELAEGYTRNEAGTEYTVTIADHAVFHDGEPVTAADVIYTVDLIKNPSVQSPHQARWEDVSVTRIDEKTVQFSTEEARPSLLENLTVGLLPQHQWNTVTPGQLTYSDLNVEAIGAGPYEVDRISQKKSGIVDSYTLTAFDDYALGAPYIDTVELVFYPNKDALYDAFEDGSIDHMNGIDPDIAYVLEQEGTRIKTALLPRVFGIFFNQDQAPLFADQAARRAIEAAIDRQAILDDVLFGYGRTAQTPVPPHLFSSPTEAQEDTGSPQEILETGGWEFNADNQTWEKDIDGETQELAFRIATGDSEDLKRAATNIKQQLRAHDIPVDISVYEIGNLNQNVIRPREYEALFFGQVIRRPSDFYAFWHSSQRNDPGLNIARYISTEADSLLEEAQEEADPVERTKLYQEFTATITEDVPAVFVYSPAFLYAIDDDINNVTLNQITTPADRFNQIHTWYMQTDLQWKFISTH